MAKITPEVIYDNSCDENESLDLAFDYIFGLLLIEENTH